MATSTEARPTAAQPPADPRSTTAGSGRRTFTLAFVGFFVVFAAWAIATPPFAAPDEQYHISRASSVVRGEIVQSENGRYGGGAGAALESRGVARAFASWRCIQNHLERSAACAKDTAADSSPVWVFSGAARYAPAYYAVVGWPTLLVFDAGVVYPMRLVSAAWCAAMLAAALVTARQLARGRWLAAGVVVAVTPQAAYLSGTVNPNAVEICGAVLAWTAALAVVTSRDRDVPTAWLRRFAVGATSLVLMRQLSPLWLLGILAACLVIAGRDRLGELRRSRRLYVWLVPPLLGTVLQVAWTYGVGTDEVPVGARKDAPTGFLLPGVLQRQPGRWVQYIGNFGSLDLPVPVPFVAAWLLLWLGPAVVALGRRTPLLARWSTGLVVLGVLVVPVLLEWPLTHRLGFFWQGRYTLPIAVGVPLVAAVALSLRRPLREPPRGLLVAGGAVVAVVGLWGFTRAFMRYSSTNEVLSIFGPWQPPVPFLVLAGCFLNAVALLGALVASTRPVPPTRSVVVDADGGGRMNGRFDG